MRIELGLIDAVILVLRGAFSNSGTLGGLAIIAHAKEM
jgi:hypothetical protein